MRVLGVDPGQGGALGLIISVGPWAELRTAVDMPVTDKRVDAIALAALVRELRPDVAAVEELAPFPQNGSQGNFRLGQAYGVVLGVLGALQVPVTLYRPAAWKKATGLSSDKEKSRARARNTWPHLAEELFRYKKDADRAEACLIALHHLRQTAPSSAEKRPPEPLQAL